MKDKAALVLALSMFTGASMAAGAGAGPAQGDAVEGQSPMTQQDGSAEAIGGGAGGDTGTDAAEAPGASPPPGADGMREGEIAQWASDEDRERFEQLDTSGTGYLTREEAQADSDLAENFDQIDADQTGVITEAEFAQFLETQNGDGVATTPGSPDGAGGVGGMPDDGGAVSPGGESGAPGQPATEPGAPN